MRFHLIQPRELFGPPERQHELDTCWRRNEGLFDKYTHPKGRPHFAELFTLCEPGMVNVIANSDIYFDNGILTARPDHGECFALSRWDIQPDGTAKHYDQPDSQDVWVVYDGPHCIPATFPMGVPGCDNSLAHILIQAGYRVSNPSKTLKGYHLHLTHYRSYLANPSESPRGADKIERIPPPYALVKPIAA